MLIYYRVYEYVYIIYTRIHKQSSDVHWRSVHRRASPCSLSDPVSRRTCHSFMANTAPFLGEFPEEVVLPDVKDQKRVYAFIYTLDVFKIFF